MNKDLPTPVSLTAERIERFADDADLNALAEAAAAAILDGGGLGWVKPPKISVLERYFHGVPLVPERELVIGRMDGVIYGAAILALPSRNNEAQAFAASIVQHFVAPYARGHGLSRLILQRTEERARALNRHVINLDVRETQTAAIAQYEAAGYVRWGTHPAYARIKGVTVQGHYYYKRLAK